MQIRTILITVFVCLTALTVNAQTQISGCTDITAQTRRWAPGSTVRVIYNGANPGQLSQLHAAVFNWNIGNSAAAVPVQFSNSSGSGPTLTFTFGQNTPDSTGVIRPAQTTITATDENGHITAATIRFDLTIKDPGPDGQLTQSLNSETSDNIFIKAAQHEMGHTMGMGEAAGGSGHCGGQISGSTVMNGICGANDWTGNMPTTVTDCDQTRVDQLYNPPPPEEGEGCQFQMCEAGCNWDCNANGGAGGCVGSGCDSPIIVDVTGDGIKLTPALKNVFDINGDGVKDSLGWTTTGTDDAWLALDRDGNGVINNGTELFGNHTYQPAAKGQPRHGFAALASYDSLLLGGNENGLIDVHDPVFVRLRLWRDSNRNGVSEASELHSLTSLGLLSIELGYKESRKVDGFGNRFRYRTKVNAIKDSGIARWAWDVFLTTK